MKRSDALSMIRSYESVVEIFNHQDAKKLIVGMSSRFPVDGSERKAMRWLGFVQGVLVGLGFFSVAEVKEHSRTRVVLTPGSGPKDIRT